MSRDTPPPKGKPPWSAPVAIRNVPETGRRFDLVADQDARAAVAESIGLRALPRLEASFDVSRHGREGLRVVGRVCATVGQTCVVTLDPIDNEFGETVDLVFEPAAAAVAADDANIGSKISGAEIASDDAPEPLVGGRVDLGVIATEFLTLGIDPYPRKAGTTFEAPAVSDDGEHPFAALAALKKGQSGHDR